MQGGRTRYGLPVILYHLLIGLTGILILIASTISSPLPSQPPLVVAFVCLLSMHVIASFLHFQYARLNIVITFESSFTIAALLIFGALPAVWLAVIGIVIGSIKRVIERRYILHKQIPFLYDVSVILLNAGMISMMWLFAAYVYFRLLHGHLPLISLTVETVLSVLIMYLSMSLINHVILYASSYYQGLDSIDFLRKAMIPAFFTEVAALPFGVVMALTYNSMGAFPFFFLGGTLLLSAAVLRHLSIIRYDLEDKLRQLNTLQRINSEIISVRDENELAGILAREASNIVAADSWYFARYDRQNDRFHFFLNSFVENSALYGLSHSAIQSKQCILISNTRNHGPSDLGPALFQEHIRSCAVAPMLAANQVHGIIVGACHEAFRFKKEHVHALTLIANETALALENLKLYGSLTDQVHELGRLNQELRQLDKMKSEFLANVSHELRTPLTSIKGYVEYIRKEKLGPVTSAQQEGLAVAHKNILRLQRLINDLLDYTRLEFKKTRLNLTACSLGKIWKEVYEQNAELIDKKKLRIQCEIPVDLPLAIVDEEKFKLVLSGLFSNAVKFTGDQGKIWVEMQMIRHHNRYYHFEVYADICQIEALLPVQISIRDTGIGIPEESIPRIFERFYQVDSSNTRKYGGTGIGLALVKSILDAHGSPIDVQSNIGQGSVFTFIVPGVHSSSLPTAFKPTKIEEAPQPKYLT